MGIDRCHGDGSTLTIVDTCSSPPPPSPPHDVDDVTVDIDHCHGDGSTRTVDDTCS